jgi:hypothetical protein
MTDPIITGIAIAGGAIAIDQINKFLGPTSEYYGERFRDNIIEKRKTNINNILYLAKKIHGSRYEEKGGISTRVLGYLLNEGSFVEDELMQLYYAGIVASSRTKDCNEDRGLFFLKLISQLSHYEIKAHFLFYTKIRDKNLNTSFPFDDPNNRERFSYNISDNDFYQYLGVENWTEYDKKTLKLEIIFRLKESGLVDSIRYENLPQLGQMVNCSKESQAKPGITIILSILGAQFYLWAHGQGLRYVEDIFKPELNLPIFIE